MTQQKLFGILSALCFSFLSACGESTTKTNVAANDALVPICAELNTTIDRNIVDIAVSAVEGDVVDKSAMQQGARLTQNSNRWSAISVNLQLMNFNKCPSRAEPIDPSIFSKQAAACHLARLQEMSAQWGSDNEKKNALAQKSSESCALKNWHSKTTG